MNQKNDYIAVFDSGVGGISVLRQLVKQMPGERFLYYGDSANAPYGTKTVAQVRELSVAVAEKLLAQGIKALVVACNTATAAAVDLLREKYADLIVVGIEPAVKLAADQFPGGTVGVMATPLTTDSEKLHALEARWQEKCNIIPLPTPGLVELVEAGKAVSAESEALLRPMLAPYAGKLDAVVLGCTHYPFAAATIRKVLGEKTVLLDGGEGTARETRRRLMAADLLRDGEGVIEIRSSAEDPQMINRCWELLKA
ncbi:MAG: glutamate racemase [Oscillospiraceae bacterium]|nr:glutamate racemase [Oscillospiraceae bacterium]MBQ9929755.1 glutamate racemase [Oscillospiraceae bacterium]